MHQTEADVVRNLFIKELDKSIKTLSGLVVDKPFGYEAFRELYKATLIESLDKLLKIREKL